MVVGRTCEGLFKWLRKKKLEVPSVEDTANLIADMMKVYEQKQDDKRTEIISRILELTKCPPTKPKLAIETVRQFARVADTYKTLFDAIVLKARTKEEVDAIIGILKRQKKNTAT